MIGMVQGQELNDFTHIVHIADLHIRTGDPDRARIEEYQTVFDEFLRTIRDLDCVQQGSCVTVIAGDVFHNKGRIESAGFQLFSKFLTRLSKLTPVFFICGNHDFRQEDLRIPDMLESMLDPWEDGSSDDGMRRIHYLKTTGLHEYGNIGFGVVSVKDSLAAGNTHGNAKVFPSFPSSSGFSTNVKYRVALYHGSIRASKLQNDVDCASAVSGSVSLSWFKGYDAVLLGDVHKQQIGRSDDGVYWGYPGSLVQQDHGESLYGHGFLLWDLQSGSKPEAHHVKNPFGMVTIRYKEEQDTFTVNLGGRRWQALDESIENANFPKRPIVRVHGMGVNSCELRLKEYGILPRGITKWLGINDTGADNDDGGEESEDDHEKRIRDELEQFSTIATSDKWLEYIQLVAPELMAYANEWFTAPEKMNVCIPDQDHGIELGIVQKLQDRATKVMKVLHAYKEALGSVLESQRNRIQLKQVAWDYTLCYGMGNVFSFDDIKGSIALLNGKNAAGKSSFLEMLCLGLFGESTRSRVVSGKKMTAKIIHNKKPMNKKAMNIRVSFMINEKCYEIVREFGVQTDKTNVSQFGVELNEIDEDENGSLYRKTVREGTTAVNTWVDKYIGSIESILLSNFITQVDQHNFFTLRQDEQKQLLERALHLEAVTAFGDLIHEAKLAHSYAIGQISAVVETTQRIQTKDAVDAPEALAQRLQRLEAEYEELSAHRNRLHQIIGPKFVMEEGIDYNERQRHWERILEKLGNMTESERIKAYEKRGARVQEIKRLESLVDTTLDGVDYETALEHLSQAESDAADWNNQKPDIASEYTIDMLSRMKQEYKVWKTANKALISLFESDTVQYNDYIQRLQEHVRKPSFERPDKVTLESSTKQPWELLDDYVMLTDQWRKLMKHPYQVEKSMEDHLAWKKKYASWRKKFSHVAQNDTPIDQYQDELAEYKTALDTLRVKEKDKQDMLNNIAELEQELKDYDDIPYNPDCWACAKQTWRTHVLDKTAKRDKLQRLIQKLQKQVQTIFEQTGTEEQSELNEKIEQLESWIEWKVRYKNDLTIWEEQLSYWTDWKKRWELAQEWQGEKDRIEDELQQLSWFLWEEVIKWGSFTSEYTKFKNMEVTVKEEWEKVKNLATWEEKKKELDDAIAQHKRLVQNHEWMNQLEDARDALAIDEKRCAKAKEYEIAQAGLAEARAGVAMAELLASNATFQELDASVKNLRMAYGHAQTQYDKYKESIRLATAQSQYLQVLQEREQKLEALDKWFNGAGGSGDDGYKHWIYTTKLIPMLQRELNRCLGGVEQLRMKIEYDKGSFIYIVEDGDRQPSLDKASGYQNFIISLCMRITLGRLGATRNDLRQLIIDEGFTSCDADNLLKMPEFLMGLLKAGDFDSILLMSHLEGIRDSTTTRVDISQEGCFSKITLGGPYLVSTYPKRESQDMSVPKEVKKRGRPKKVVSAV